MQPKWLKSRSKLHLCPCSEMLVKLLSTWDVCELTNYLERWRCSHALQISFYMRIPFPQTLTEPQPLQEGHCGESGLSLLWAPTVEPLWQCCLWTLVIFFLPHLPSCGSLALHLLPSHWPSSLCPQGQAVHAVPSHAKGWASAGAGRMLPVDW